MIALKIDNVIKLEAAIGLIFEKAVSEPGFSVAYANMCRILTNEVSTFVKVLNTLNFTYNIQGND